MADEFQEGRHTLIIGGGYIGLEAAAVAAKKGVNVTLVEMADRILQRVAAPQTSDYFRAAHTAQGVDIREGVGLDHLIERDGRVGAAKLSDGVQLSSSVQADMSALILREHQHRSAHHPLVLLR